MGLDRQLQHELPVLALPDLQEGPVVRGADVVAFGVHEEDVGRLVADMAPQDEGRRAVGPHLARAPPCARRPPPGSGARGRAPPRTGGRPWPGSRSPPRRRGHGPCGRGPPAWSPGCRPTRSRTGDRGRVRARASCGTCRRRRRPRSCGCRPGRACPRGGAGPGSRSTASSSLRVAQVGDSDGRPGEPTRSADRPPGPEASPGSVPMIADTRSRNCLERAGARRRGVGRRGARKGGP